MAPLGSKPQIESLRLKLAHQPRWMRRSRYTCIPARSKRTDKLISSED